MFCLLRIIRKEKKSADVSELLPHSSHSEINICSTDDLLALAHRLHPSPSSETLRSEALTSRANPFPNSCRYKLMRKNSERSKVSSG